MSETKTIQERFRDLKVVVLVPTYNNATTLAEVLHSLLVYTDQVIVVDDGSTDATKEILKKSFAHLTVVSYNKNVGKGWALRLGFKKALELGLEYVISIDSDGQHFANDLVQFLDKVEEERNAIIIGARNMDQDSIPGKSSFGNKFSNFWFKVETGFVMPDTQSGYRLYPIRSINNINFFCKKYEFEIEVLVRSAWKGINITSVPVKVFYPEAGKRISHFRPFKDFTRISILNTILVTIAFLYIKPRDFLRDIKKKTSGRSFTTYSSARMSQID